MPIEGFDDYFISNHGRVRSDKKPISTIFKDKIIPSGYKQVKLSIKGAKYYRYVHRLVAQAFVDNPNNLPWVNHIDGNKINNSWENLEWVMPSENTKHAFRIGLNHINEKQRQNLSLMTRLKQSKKIEQTTVDGKHICFWDNACDTQKELGFDRANIATACRKGIVRYGYRWRYVC